MTTQIEKVFRINVELLELAEKAIVYFREQDFGEAFECMPAMSEKMKEVIDGIVGSKEYFTLVSIEALTEMLEGIVDASKEEDYVLLADLLESRLCTLLCNIQELIIKKENYAFFSETVYQEQCAAMLEKLKKSGTENAERLFEMPLNPEELLRQGYRVEVTECGLMTVAVGTDRGSVYLHSKNKVALEAFLLARSWARQEADTYYVKGFGMGYHVLELAKQKPKAKIKVYENNGQIIKLACAFSKLTGIFENANIAIYYDPEGEGWRSCAENLDEKDAVCLHMPSVQAGSALYSLRK